MDTKEIIGFENYTIDKLGNIYSKKNNIYLKACLNTGGYLQIGLYKNSKKIYKLIHCLIGEHFIDNPNNYECLDHIDRNKKNNDLNNLRWCTQRQNQQNMTNQSIYGHNIYKTKYGTFRVQFKNNKGKIIFDKTFKTLEEAIEQRDQVNENIDSYK